MKDKNKRRIVTTIIIIILLLLLIGLSLFVILRNLNAENGNFLEISNSQIKASNPNLTGSSEEEYFELVGFGQLEINNDNPNLNLINPSGNSVYLCFDVIYNDDVLYSTKLIEPGKMEQFNIYSYLDAGEYTIDYKINVYDLNSQKPLWTGIQQKQEILIKK